MQLKTKFVSFISLLLLASIVQLAGANEPLSPAHGPGDRKQGYESKEYVTNSLSLNARLGKSADLLSLLNNPPLGLPKVPQPGSNLITEEKLQLGRRLFFDRRLSFNDTLSCGTCHIPEQGFTNNEISTAVGVEGRSGKRNTPTIYNIAFITRLFHDGRETSLEQLVWGPLLAHNEMANPSVGHVVEKIKKINDYDGWFESAFEGKGPTMETIGMALSAYQRALLSANSRFDRWKFGGDSSALTEQEKFGFDLFIGKGNCAACHLVQDRFATFTDNRLHNTGMGYQTSMGSSEPDKRTLIAPGIYMTIPGKVIESVRQQPRPNDMGLYDITQNPFDRWKFRTPTLRNVALTAPYMHNGRLLSLKDVVEFYNQGGIKNELLSPLIKPLDLTDEEVDALVSFLNTLTGDNIEMLVTDAFDVPIGDTRDHDPHWSNEIVFNK